MPISISPTSNTFYIAYTDSGKRGFVGSFSVGSTQSATTRFALNQINQYTSFSAFNLELEALGQDAWSYNPFTQNPPGPPPPPEPPEPPLPDPDDPGT